jgi:IS1 family transposase
MMLDARHKSSYINRMSKLAIHERVQILSMLVEGSSMRSVSRVVGVSINTVSKLLIEAGQACIEYHDENVRGLKSERIQCDEIWSFCYAKEKNAGKDGQPDFAGDIWTWTSLDADSKLICNWFVGGRDAEYANLFMDDLADRLDNRVQLTTDGHKAYLKAVDGAFGNDIDYATLIKLYGPSPTGKTVRYSPAECTGIKKIVQTGNPEKKHVSTSYVERQNLNMRMGMRRFTRLTNAFSKKYENHCHAISLYFVYYNFIRKHATLKTTPAVAAGLATEPYTMEWIVSLIEARAPKTGRPMKEINT